MFGVFIRGHDGMGTGAFFRVEGTLTPRPTIAAAAFLAGNAQQLGERVARLTGVALAAPFATGPLFDPTTALRLAWAGARGMSEDRMVVLGEEYATRFLVPSVRPIARDLLATAKQRGHEVVLISDNLDVVIAPLAKHLGVATFVANRMEMRDGKATGRLCDPLINATAALDWARGFSRDRGIDLAGSLAYGASGEDRLLLGAAGHPCAVHPDRALRRVARELDWPVVER